MRLAWPWLPGLWLAAALAAWATLGQGLLLIAWAGALAWVTGLLARCAPRSRTPMDWAVLLLLGWLPVNYWASADKALSIPAAANLVAGLAVFYLAIAVAQTAHRERLAFDGFLLVGAAMVLAVLLIPDRLSVALPWPSGLLALARGVGETVNANILAGALLPAGVMAAGVALGRDAPIRRVGAAVLLAAAAAVMLLGASRGALLGLGAGLIALLFALGGRYRWAALILAAGAGVVLWRLGPQILLNLGDGQGTVSSLAGRTEIWSRALYALQDFPFTGIGIGTFSRVIPLLYPYFTIGPDVAVPHAHNLFLQVGVDLGLPGLIAYAIILVLGLWGAAGAVRPADKSSWPAAVLAALVAVLVHGLIDATLWGTKPAFILWWLLGLSAISFVRSHHGASGVLGALS